MIELTIRIQKDNTGTYVGEVILPLRNENEYTLVKGTGFYSPREALEFVARGVYPSISFPPE